MPWLPPGATAVLDGRGEVFYRHHAHPDPSAPTLLLLHGWTANADTQFFSAYEALAEGYSFVAIDHRGHGRGMRSSQPFTLEDVADDAAALVRRLGVGPVITVGYSMGGPVSLLVAQRHPDLVQGMVLQATALEWRTAWRDRVWRWALPLTGSVIRSRIYPRVQRKVLARMVGPDRRDVALWIDREFGRNDAGDIVEAGRALGRFDSSDWASTLAVPTAMLVTTRDRQVRLKEQRALAAATHAHVEEQPLDHLCTIVNPMEYSAATRRLVDHVAQLVRQPATQTTAFG